MPPSGILWRTWRRDRAELARFTAALARYYKVCSAYHLPPGDLQTLAGDALELWLEAGILDVWNIEGEEYLAFRHMTFQEYAAAYMLTDALERTHNIHGLTRCAQSCTTMPGANPFYCWQGS